MIPIFVMKLVAGGHFVSFFVKSIKLKSTNRLRGLAARAFVTLALHHARLRAGGGQEHGIPAICFELIIENQRSQVGRWIIQCLSSKRPLEIGVELIFRGGNSGLEQMC